MEERSMLHSEALPLRTREQGLIPMQMAVEEAAAPWRPASGSALVAMEPAAGIARVGPEPLTAVRVELEVPAVREERAEPADLVLLAAPAV
jgi:hypothetical protein